MTIRDKLHRYFVANGAPIFSIRRSTGFDWKRIPCRTGNSNGFYWLWFQVEWRKPYADCWAYNPIANRWEIPSSLPAQGERIQ